MVELCDFSVTDAVREIATGTVVASNVIDLPAQNANGFMEAGVWEHARTREKLDVVFLVDGTGSMSEEIAGIRDNIHDFVDRLQTANLDFRVGGIVASEAGQTLLRENLNLSIEHTSADRAVVRLPFTENLTRVGGTVCGQALMALADTAMVFACAGHLGDFVPVATTNLETRFLSAARGEHVRCTARVIRAGRAMIFAEARLESLPDAREVAVGSATYFKPSDPR